jgi:hypothetical protein
LENSGEADRDTKVLPRGKNGEWEVMMCLEELDMRAFVDALEDGGWLITEQSMAKL